VRVHRALHGDGGAVRCAHPVVVVALQMGRLACCPCYQTICFVQLGILPNGDNARRLFRV
jgi:hypothetical protein